jgi:hypothetical protein
MKRIVVCGCSKRLVIHLKERQNQILSSDFQSFRQNLRPNTQLEWQLTVHTVVQNVFCLVDMIKSSWLYSSVVVLGFRKTVKFD